MEDNLKKNIYDIAKLAGVSIATVSRVVNNSTKVSASTKERVLSVMKEYKYTPNVFARGLGLDSMKTIGIICPDVSDFYMAKAVAALEKGLHSYGYDCILYCSGLKREGQIEAIKRIVEKRIDALILVGSQYVGDGCDQSEIEHIVRVSKTIPIFLINGMIKEENIYSIYSDDYMASYQATREILESGRRKVLFLYDTDSFSAKRKMEGYETALKEYKIPILYNLKLKVDRNIETIRDLLLIRKDIEFDSVVCINDVLAIGVIKYAHAKQIKIPDDLVIVGYNNSEIAICTNPELSSIDNRAEKMCTIAIEHMMKVLQGEEVSKEEVFECKLIKRSTTDF
ncbi:MAG: LacI family DNA-binding transcriptional regulator [Lachnospiraceae bacterium]